MDLALPHTETPPCWLECGEFDRHDIPIRAGGKLAYFTCFSTSGMDREWVQQRLAGLQANIPESLLYILAIQKRELFLIERPDDVGRSSRVRKEDDFYGRADAEIEGIYIPVIPQNIIEERGGHLDTLNQGRIMVSRQCYSSESACYVSYEDYDGVLAHEIMHAVDDSFLKINPKSEFSVVYAMDDAAFEKHDQRYGYLRQEGDRGRSEVVADSGMQIFAGKCRAGNMQRDWKYSYYWMEKFIDGVKRRFNAELLNPAVSDDKARSKFAKSVSKDAEYSVLCDLLLPDPEFRTVAQKYTSMNKYDFDKMIRDGARQEPRLTPWKNMLHNYTKGKVKELLSRTVAAPTIPTL